MPARTILGTLNGSQLTDLTEGLPLDDRELTHAFKRGDSSAFRTIHERYQARVESVCRRMLVNPDDAAEATQETFLRVYQALGRFNGRYQMGAWITRIATNVCLDHLRTRIRKPMDDVPNELLELEPSNAEGTLDPELLLLRESESRRVRKLLAKLPPMHRAAIVLREYEGLSYDEIAIALGMTDSQVKALLHRARQRFKKTWLAAAASALIPTRLLQRLRRIEAPIREHATSSMQAGDAMTSATQTMATCGTALQQCGQFVAERVMPLAAAALVGGATVGAALVPPRTQPIEQAQRLEAAGSHGEDHESKPVVTHRSARAGTTEESEPHAGEAETLAAPAAEPEPVPEPTTSEAPPSDDGEPTDEQSSGGDGSGDGTTEPITEPEGFAMLFDTDIATDNPCNECLSATSVTAANLDATSDGLGSFSQELSGSATAAGQSAYGLRLEHSANADDHEARFFLKTARGSFLYHGRADFQSREPTDWGGWLYRYAGTYDRISGRDDGLPENGAYTFTISFSYRSDRIVSSSFSLTEF